MFSAFSICSTSNYFYLKAQERIILAVRTRERNMSDGTSDTEGMHYLQTVQTGAHG